MRRIVTVFACAAIALSLGACSQVPDPEENVESLTAVTESPPEPEATERYSVEADPEPMVEAQDCDPYLLVTARGTGEPSKGQLLGPVSRAIAKARPEQVRTIDLDYPADTDVKLGGTIGVRLLIDTLNVQAEACPAQRFVLLGYSQGALVIGDALSDPASRLVGESTGELEPEAVDRILAVVLYGNPRFSGGEAYAEGDYVEGIGGILPRDPGVLDAFAERLRDYCVAGDFVCQSSLELDESGHVAYFDNGMQQDGAAFAIARLPPPSSAPAAAEAWPSAPDQTEQSGSGRPQQPGQSERAEVD